MARDPGSLWKPLPEAGDPDGHKKTQFLAHSTGTLAPASANWRYFANGGVLVESTFIVGLSERDPTLQIMDSTDKADANGSANRRAISVEVVGTGEIPFTDWQIRELVRLGRWAAEEHPIPFRVCPAHDEGGYGWHVMFGAPGPWTKVAGKVCPGARRINQLRDVIFPAIFRPETPTPPPPTVPELPDLEDEPMKLITAPNRGIALVGPDLYVQVEGDAVGVNTIEFGEPIMLNERQFDVRVAQSERARDFRIGRA